MSIAILSNEYTTVRSHCQTFWSVPCCICRYIWSSVQLVQLSVVDIHTLVVTSAFHHVVLTELVGERMVVGNSIRLEQCAIHYIQYHTHTRHRIASEADTPCLSLCWNHVGSYGHCVGTCCCLNVDLLYYLCVLIVEEDSCFRGGLVRYEAKYVVVFYGVHFQAVSRDAIHDCLLYALSGE